jgi:tripartite-type tricarboxylate transporter receptor subunit TctC
MHRSWLSRGLGTVACLTALILADGVELAAQEAYPTRTVTIVVPYTAGGGVDSVARLVGEDMQASLGQAVIVDNVPGASGMIGAQRVTRANPDGYTLLLSAAGEIAVKPHLKKKMTYDPIKDLAPISLVARVPNVLVVGGNTDIMTLNDFIARAKANPGTLAYATSGIGNPQHLAGELFNRMAGVETIHSPYRGAAQQITDVVGGHVQATYASLAAMLPFIKEERVRAIGVTSAERLPTLPDVPAIGEHPSFKGFEVVNWFGLFAPAQTPEAVIEKLNAAVSASLAKPETRSRLEELGALPSPTTPAEFKTFIVAESDKFGKIIDQAGQGNRI